MYSNGIIIRVVGWITVCILLFPKSSESVLEWALAEAHSEVYVSQEKYTLTSDGQEPRELTGYLNYRATWAHIGDKNIAVMVDAKDPKIEVNYDTMYQLPEISGANGSTQPDTNVSQLKIKVNYGHQKIDGQDQVYDNITFEFVEAAQANDWKTIVNTP